LGCFMRKILLLAAFVGLVATQAQAGTLDIFVGYTDTLRASGFAPSPFCTGFTNTCQVDTQDQLDGGVFRFDNNTGGAVDITNIKVSLEGGALNYQLWGDVLGLPNGSKAIFGQTNSSENFDTSDYYQFFSDKGIGFNGIGGCTYYGDLSPSEQATCTANLPVISFDLNGVAMSVTDCGSILNTGGYDFVNSSSDGNESIGWHAICTDVTTRGNGVPEPVTLSVFGVGLIGAFAARRRRKTA